MLPRYITHLSLLLLVIGILFLPQTVVMSVAETATEEPCMVKCFLNFMLFIAAPIIFIAGVFYLEIRNRDQSDSAADDDHTSHQAV